MTRTGRVSGIVERKIPANQGGPFPVDPKAQTGYTGYFVQVEVSQPEGLPKGSPAVSYLDLQVTLEEAQGMKVGQTVTLG